MKKILPVFFFLLPVVVCGQNSVEKNIEPAHYFDFWIGKWDLEWNASDGTIEYGTNKIEKILNGKVLLENFEALSGRFQGYQGKSVSILDKRDQVWKQTWVDSEGAYLDFTGKIEGSKRIFYREFENDDGEMVMQRMVFYNIHEDSLDWDWQRSVDGGESWQLQWRIHYTRSE